MTADATVTVPAEATETAQAKPNRNLTVAQWRTIYAGRRAELQAAVEKQDWPKVQGLSVTMQRIMTAAAKAALAEAPQA